MEQYINREQGKKIAKIFKGSREKASLYARH